MYYEVFIYISPSFNSSFAAATRAQTPFSELVLYTLAINYLRDIFIHLSVKLCEATQPYASRNTVRQLCTLLCFYMYVSDTICAAIAQ